MSVPRFVITPGADISKPVELDSSESHHVRQVLRLAEGDVVELLDGCGGRYHGSIDTIGATVSVRVIDVVYEIPATPSLWLYQGELKQAKTDELVEKCVELGVTRFIPVTCARTQGRRDGRRLQKRWKRRENIVRGACKQCGRATFMEVAEEGDFATLISGSGDHGIIRIMFYEGARAAFDATLIAGTGTRRICLLTGPEGGFTDREVELARADGWRVAGLGDVVVRAETAAVAAITIVQHRLGRL
jgi:16S rRNA (uracil1498-N3)-methyltransferase